MVKMTLGIDGMACGMCEAHINEAIRKAFRIKKVTSSHSKKQTIIITEQEIPEQALKDVINETGYYLTSIKSEPYQKKDLFSIFRR